MKTRWKQCPRSGGAIANYVIDETKEDLAESLHHATEEADELRAGMFAANIRIEELRAVLLEVLPLIDGTRRSAMDFPIVTAKVRKAVEGN